MVNQATSYTAAGVVPTRLGNQHPSIAPYELLRASDRDLIVAVGTNRQFAALCEALGAPELARDSRFATNAERVAWRRELIQLLEARLVHGTADDWAHKLIQARVPAGVVNDVAGAFRLAEQLGLNPIVHVPADDGTTVGLTRNPIGLSLTPPTYRLAPPCLGSTSVDDLDAFAPERTHTHDDR